MAPGPGAGGGPVCCPRGGGTPSTPSLHQFNPQTHLFVLGLHPQGPQTHLFFLGFYPQGPQAHLFVWDCTLRDPRPTCLSWDCTFREDWALGFPLSSVCEGWLQEGARGGDRGVWCCSSRAQAPSAMMP